METTTTTKVCSKCGRELPLSQFNKCARNKDGLQYMCKECHSVVSRERYARVRASASITPASSPNPALNPKFSDKTPRELQQDMRELKEELIARGFNCEVKLTYLHEIII